MSKVGTIIVLYNPQKERLSEALDVLLPQVACALLIDNSDGDNSQLYAHLGNKVHYIPMMHNVGIAKAQNVGIKRLRQMGAEYILFSDQDTVCEPHLVEYLLKGHQTLSRHFEVAAVGPQPINKSAGISYLHNEYVCQQGSVDGLDYIDYLCLISSFSLVKMSAFDTVGLYDETLFIDMVETSWCFRAAHYHDMRSFMLPSVTVDHIQGRAGTLFGKTISISTPPRTYYQTRNLLWVCRTSYAPKVWRRRNLRNLFVKLFYYPLCVPNRWAYVKSFARGLRDGIFKTHRPSSHSPINQTKSFQVE